MEKTRHDHLHACRIKCKPTQPKEVKVLDNVKYHVMLLLISMKADLFVRYFKTFRNTFCKSVWSHMETQDYLSS